MCEIDLISIEQAGLPHGNKFSYNHIHIDNMNGRFFALSNQKKIFLMNKKECAFYYSNHTDSFF